MGLMVEAVVSSGFHVSMRVPPLLGDGWRDSEFQFDDSDDGFRASRSRVRRSCALEMTGRRTARDAGVEALPPTQRNLRAALALLRMGDARQASRFHPTRGPRNATLISSRELGIHRATVRKYLDAEGPPTRRPWEAPRRQHLIPWHPNRVTFMPAA